MKIINPIEVTDAVLASSDVPEDDHAEWDNVTDYAIGDYAISLATHTVYRALVANGPGSTIADPDQEQIALADPLIDDPNPINWQVISATNRWKAFDQKPSVQAIQIESITYAFMPGEIVTGIAAFRVGADTMHILMTDPTDGIVYDRTIDLTDETAIIDWFTYYFEPVNLLEETVCTDLPPYSAATIELTFERPGGTVHVGQIAFGRVREVGFVEVKNSGFQMLDFSFVNLDEFGNLTTVKRQATRLSEFDVVVSTLAMSSVDRLLRDLRGGTPAVWVGDDDSRRASLAYGFHRNTRNIYSEGDWSLLNIQVQGVV